MKAFSANIYKRSLPRWPSYTCASGNRLAWDASETATNLYAYDGAGRLTNHVVNGQTRTFAYNFQGRMTSLTDIDGSVFAYEFDGEGNRLSQSLNDCLSKRFVYDGADVLLELNPTNGVAYAWVNGPGIDQPIERLLFIDGAPRARRVFHADALGSVAALTGTAQTPVFYEYGVATNGVRWTRTRTAAANSPAWRLDETDFLGRPFRSSAPAFGGGTVVETRFYDAPGRLSAVETLAGTNLLRTLHAHDALSRPFRSALDADGDGTIGLASPDRVTDAIERFESDGTDLWQVRETLAYPYENSAAPFTSSVRRVRLTGLGATNALGVLAAETVDIDPYGVATTSRTWRARATQTRVETSASPRSSVTAADIYVAGLLRTSLSSSGVLATNTYDALGRRTLTRTGGDAHASGVLLGYDAAGRPAWQEDLAGNRTTFAYDPATGRRVTVTDALTNVVYTLYDLQGRVTNTWGATYPVGYEYDAFGRLAAMQTWRDENAAPDVTHWNYDPATGLLTNKVYADGLGPRYEYDPAGRLAKRVWARGVETDYAYDALGQLVSIDYSDATPDEAFTYDRLGRPLTITDVLGTRTNVYDALTLLEERMPDGEVLARSVDSFGRPSGIALDADYAVGYAYDNFGRFASVAISSGVQFDYSYVSDSSLLAGWSISNGAAATYAYEPNRDLRTEVVNTFDGSPVSAFTYAYDAVGRRTQRVDSGLTTNLFGYNVRSELADAIMGTNTYTYSYDPIGNRQQASVNAVTNLYQANELNQYTNINEGAVEPVYDADGNMTSSGSWQFTWDAENRLVKASPRVLITGSRIYEYEYDYMGRRVKKTEKRHTMPVFTWTMRSFEYDGWNLLRERVEFDGAVSTNQYVWGLDLSGSLQGAGGVGGLLTILSPDSCLLTPAYDANGNITDLVDTNGAVVAHYEYDPYGNTIAHSADQTDANPFRFSSKYWDGETGFYDYGYRFYSSALGRWLSRDPIGELGGYNFYLAFNNNPISGYDALGLIVLKSSYEESTSLDELKELRSWLMSLPALPSLGEYQQALVNLQFWFNVDASRPSKLEISEEWLKRQPAVRTSITRLVQHFTTATGDKELGGKSGCEWAHDKLKGSAVGTVVDFPEGIAWQASVNPGPLDALYPAMGGFHFDGTGHFKIKKVDNKGTYEFIGSVDVSFTDPYDWHEGLGILVPLWRVNELKNPATKALLGIEGDVPRVLNITDGAMLKLKSAGLGKDYDMKGQFEIKVSKQCCVP